MKSNHLAAESVASTQSVYSAFDLVSLVAPFAIAKRAVQVPAGNSALNGNSAGNEEVAAKAVAIPSPAIGA